MRLPLPSFRLFETFFRKFFNVPKGSSLHFLIFCNRTNVKKFKRVSSFRFLGSETVKNSHFFENFSKYPNGPTSIFLNYRKRMDVEKSQRTPLSQFSALWDFSKVIIFVLKLGFLRPSTLYSIFFQRPVFFICDFFIFFHRSPSSIFTKNETFCDSKGLVKVFGTMRLQKNCRCSSKKFFENILEKFRKIFEKKISFNFLFF